MDNQLTPDHHNLSTLDLSVARLPPAACLPVGQAG